MTASKSEGVIEQIIELADDFVVGYMELMEDPIFHRIPTESCLTFVNFAIDSGQKMAEEIAEEFGTREPAVIAESLGAKIIQDPKENIIESFSGNDSLSPYVVRGARSNVIRLVIRSEYQPTPPTIFLYGGSISHIKKFIMQRKIQHLFQMKDVMEEVTKVYIAHEMFHHFEETRIEPISKRFKVDVLKLGPIHIRSDIRSLSEIAANVFARTLLNLRRSLKVIDYILMERKAYELLMKIREIRLRMDKAMHAHI